MALLRKLWSKLFRKSCVNGHQTRRARFREHNSRFLVALTVCTRCHAVLEAEGRRER